jgi:hypothetical protein
MDSISSSCNAGPIANRKTKGYNRCKYNPDPPGHVVAFLAAESETAVYGLLVQLLNCEATDVQEFAEVGNAEKTIFLSFSAISLLRERFKGGVHEGLNVVEELGTRTNDFNCYGRQGELATGR